MLKKFIVENFKSFQGRYVFDLSNPNNYAFNPECVNNGIVSKAIIYGVNGIGKSNFGLALFDIVNNLTEKSKNLSKYGNFLNFNSNKSYAYFEYEFVFDGITVVYSYRKLDVSTLIEETLNVDGTDMIYYDYVKKDGYSKFKGTEVLKLSDDGNNSRVKYILNTAVFEEKKEEIVLKKFNSFVNSMLLFYSLRNNDYIGYKQGADSIEKIIIESGKISEFEEIINSQGLGLKLEALQTPEGKKLYFKFKKGDIYFYDACSTGMISLILLYSWYIQIDNCSFVFIDEFDAFYHYELAELIVKKLKEKKNIQIITTTHNTDLLNNDLLRPDCYYLINNEKIDSLNHLTEKDLRYAHNLQKMFKAGAFK